MSKDFCRAEEMVAELLQGRRRDFSHRDHVFVAWAYLGEMGVPQAMIRLRDELSRIATVNGAPERYHETITFAFLVLVGERRRTGEAFEAFSARNEDLLVAGVLHRFYSKEALRSPRARERFVFPDLSPGALAQDP